MIFPKKSSEYHIIVWQNFWYKCVAEDCRRPSRVAAPCVCRSGSWETVGYDGTAIGRWKRCVCVCVFALPPSRHVRFRHRVSRPTRWSLAADLVSRDCFPRRYLRGKGVRRSRPRNSEVVEILATNLGNGVKFQTDLYFLHWRGEVIRYRIKGQILPYARRRYVWIVPRFR